MKSLLNNLNTTELKKLAKDLKIKNWWTLKKSDLVEKIELEQINIVDKLNSKADTKINEQPKMKVVGVGEEAHISETPRSEIDDKEDLVTLKDILHTLKIKGTKARRILRNANIDRPYKRWEWSATLHKDIIQQVKDLLN